MTLPLFLDHPEQQSCKAEVISFDGTSLVTDQTVFYAASGGQPGDTGTLSYQLTDGEILDFPIIDTRKAENGTDILHILDTGDSLETSPLKQGATVELALDWARRHKHMRMHSCMHLLCASVEGHVTGGQITAEKGRLDFAVDNGVLDKEELTAKLNALITENHPISTQWTSYDILDSNPDLVRTLSVKPPAGAGGQLRLVRIGADDARPVDLQPCGGTHVQSTGEIGPVIVSKIENKGKMNKRVNVVFA